MIWPFALVGHWQPWYDPSKHRVLWLSKSTSFTAPAGFMIIQNELHGLGQYQVIHNGGWDLAISCGTLWDNNIHASFFRGRININLHFLSFFYTDMTQTVEILHYGRQGHTYFTVNILCALMTWWRNESGHQPWWYCPSYNGIMQALHVKG